MRFFWQVPPARPFDEIWTDYIDTFATLNMYRAELGLRILTLPDDDPSPRDVALVGPTIARTYSLAPPKAEA